MADFFLKSGSGATFRANSTAYANGDRMVIARADTSTNYSVARKWVFECTTAGTSGAAVPTWPASVTQDVTTVTDGTVTWTARKPGYSSGTTVSWSFAAIDIQYICSALSAGDTLYISNNHNESITQTTTHGIDIASTFASPTKLICVDDSVTSGFTATTGASITCNYPIMVAGAYHILLYGISLTSTYGGSGGISIGAYGKTYIEKCTVYLNTTSTNMTIGISNSGSITGYIELVDCSFKFGSTSQYVGIGSRGSYIRGGSVLSGGTSPATVFYCGGSGISGKHSISGFDFSNCAATVNLTSGGGATLYNCKLPANWSGSVLGGVQSYGIPVTEMHNCDSGDTNFRIMRVDDMGTVVTDTGIYNDAGATDGTTRLSWKMVSDNDAEFPHNYLSTGEIVKWNDTTGSSVTATVEIVHNSQGSGTNGVLNDDEIWLEVMYLGTSGYPLGTWTSDRKAILGTAAAQTTSSAAWTGDSAGWDTQKLEVTFTPQEKGYVHARVCLAKASATVYVDPLITLA